MGNRELAAYLEADMQSTSPVEVVIMLYDVLVRDMKRIIAAIRAGDIQERVNNSNHAFGVLQQLECMLDMERGSSTAMDLSRVYSHFRAKVMEVQFKLDPALLERQIDRVLELREGWVQAMAVPEVSHAAPASVAAELAGYPQSGVTEMAHGCEWSA